MKILLMLLVLMQPTMSYFKTEDEVFGKWKDWQKVYKDCSLARTAQDFNNNYWARFVERYQKQEEWLEPFVPFLRDTTGVSLSKKQALPELSSSGKQMLTKIYSWLDNDIHKLLNYMKNHHVPNAEINAEEQESEVEDVIKKYKSLLKLFFNEKDKSVREQQLFAFANRMFEFCFGMATFPRFHAWLKDEPSHQIARFCYVSMWFYLVGEGWKHWHEDCLKNLTTQAQAGKEVVYIAGGNDIYELLKRGIYRIRIIDPMLPSQPDYYSEGWDWLLKGEPDAGIGGRLELNFSGKKIVMKREKYDVDGSFSASLSTGKTVRLAHSVTEWVIYDIPDYAQVATTGRQEEQKLGYVIFERRFCNQQDFVIKSDQVLLASFNEMYFIAMPQHLYGWGIDVNQLPGDCKLYVKQLRKPVNVEIMKNLVHGEDSNFSFIMLGSCAT